MIKSLNTLLFVLLLSACSSQESNEKTTNTQPIMEKNTTVSTTTEKTTPNSIPQKEANNSVLDRDATSQAEITKPKETTKSPAKTSLFSLTTLEGKTINITETPDGLVFEEFKDKAVILLFFGYKCPPCRAEIPVLKGLINKGHKDLEIIALEVQGLTNDQLGAFKKQQGINYHLITGEGNYEFISYIGDKANWQGAIPFLIGFNKKGTVNIVHVGGIGASEFDNIYDTLSKGEAK
jgi:thiol-disulfide isomerase/thioredoxin